MTGLKGLIIAAGSGVRLRPLTESKPKALLPIFGKTLINHVIHAYNKSKVEEIGIITGFKQETLRHLKAEFFENREFLENNILHSLMKARSFFENSLKENCDLVISYSDIFFTPEVLAKLVNTAGDTVVVVDKDWIKLYKTREDNPIEQAERVEYSSEKVISIGKELVSNPLLIKGEFIGLLKLTPAGIRHWLTIFDDLNSKLLPTDPFMRAKEWRKSYLTDFLQETINRGITVSFCEISNDWIELDTLGDYERVSRFKTYQDYHKECIE